MPTRLPHTAFGLSFIALVSLGLAQADEVRQRDAEGKVKVPRKGKILEVTKEHVKLQINPSKTEDIPANTIDSVGYDGQPPSMGLLPGQVRGGNYVNANEQIRLATEAASDHPGVKDELAYYQMYVAAKVAMAGGRLVEMKQAKDAVAEYLKKGLLSWHYYDAVELLGELCLAIAPLEVENLRAGWYRLAIDEAYSRLRQAPWPETEIRAWIAQAKAQHLVQDASGSLASYDKAIEKAEDVIKKTKDADGHFASLALAAKVGKAEVLGDTKPEEGIKLIQEIIAKASEEDSRVQAVSAVAIARCYQKANNPKEALIHYVKVDVLYYQQENLHAEALYNLSRLWAAPPFNRADRAQEAADTLRTRYPGSVWTARLGGG